jgi:hypothetical protein
MLKKYLIVERKSDITKFDNIRQLVDNIFEVFKNNLQNVVDKKIRISNDEDAKEKLFHLKFPKNKVVYLNFEKKHELGHVGVFVKELEEVTVYNESLNELQDEAIAFIIENKNEMDQIENFNHMLAIYLDMKNALMNDTDLQSTLYHELVHFQDSDKKWFEQSIKKYLNKLNEVGSFENIDRGDYVAFNHEMNAYVVDAVEKMHRLAGGLKLKEFSKEFKENLVDVANRLSLKGKPRRIFMSRVYLLYSYLTQEDKTTNNKLNKIKDLI